MVPFKAFRSDIPRPVDNPSSSKGKSTCLTISGHPCGGFVRGFFAGFTPSGFRTREKKPPEHFARAVAIDQIFEG
ncbi:hypothetical protein RB10047 [Rhodopirellula baltica SH 1]|uniref:Uncharacterized protein n=1 Tax=Rhodopirellula baltica (strain DSM 10527 / NCIMB 13988 / SH1) TaxID=243090 RepID=Q7UKN0_RHOBA|nr:hypothetical protein RB10047 [Rhodopirellula baltica SH 1]